MKKKNGFIATSLIYSFFLVFITLFLTIIADYLQNKVLLNTIESDIKEDINKKKGIKDFLIGDVITFESSTFSNLTINGFTIECTNVSFCSDLSGRQFKINGFSNIVNPEDGKIDTIKFNECSDAVCSSTNSSEYSISLNSLKFIVNPDDNTSTITITEVSS